MTETELGLVRGLVLQDGCLFKTNVHCFFLFSSKFADFAYVMLNASAGIPFQITGRIFTAVKLHCISHGDRCAANNDKQKHDLHQFFHMTTLHSAEPAVIG
jgi:hypothetical protein